MQIDDEMEGHSELLKEIQDSPTDINAVVTRRRKDFTGEFFSHLALISETYDSLEDRDGTLKNFSAEKIINLDWIVFLNHSNYNMFSAKCMCRALEAGHESFIYLYLLFNFEKSNKRKKVKIHNEKAFRYSISCFIQSQITYHLI